MAKTLAQQIAMFTAERKHRCPDCGGRMVIDERAEMGIPFFPKEGAALYDLSPDALPVKYVLVEAAFCMTCERVDVLKQITLFDTSTKIERDL